MKRFLPVLSALALLLSAGTTVSAAEPGNTCVYVLGHIDGKTVTTPAKAVVIPDSAFSVSPAKVHVDETLQKILGYSLNVPGGDVETPPLDGIIVPGYSTEIPSYTFKIQDLNIDECFCYSNGVETPAVPVHIPESALTVPGTKTLLPTISMNILGQQKLLSGYLLETEDEQIVVPEVDLGLPPLNLATPDSTIMLNLNGGWETVKFLPHNQ
ncbi:hypothetical protein [Brevibacillus dissolubilis]|uniref:hypothetical protein n=1 Tax=Brevibacillus dissolubilis TaxID=1844116 RepID=UPI0011171487|nr:hypothetical protein [Brevibacillus dissolubilis]